MKLSLAVSSVGIIALFVFLQFTEPKSITSSEVEKNIGGNVVLSGVITSYAENRGTIFITVDNSTKVVMFSTDAERTNVYRTIINGDNVTITGKVQLYRGEPEIIAKNIRKIP